MKSQARTTLVRQLSQRPSAVLASELAESGAMIIRSKPPDLPTCANQYAAQGHPYSAKHAILLRYLQRSVVFMNGDPFIQMSFNSSVMGHVSA